MTSIFLAQGDLTRAGNPNIPPSGLPDAATPLTLKSPHMTSPYAKALDQTACHPDYQAGIAVLDAFLTAFNARDAIAWAATLHYPHVRFAGDQVQIWHTPADYAADNDIGRLAETGWHHTRWDWRRLVQAGDDKLHFLVSFTRFDQDARPLASYEALYLLTRRDGRWGIQSRSSYAGIAVPGAAY